MTATDLDAAANAIVARKPKKQMVRQCRNGIYRGRAAIAIARRESDDVCGASQDRFKQQ